MNQSKINDLIDVLHDKRILKMRPAHWKARLVVSLILLGCSVIGVLLASFIPSIVWTYWLYMVPFFAILCIWLSWYVSRSHKVEKSVVWHEILHWFALLMAVYIVASIVRNGVVSELVGALFVLILLALTLFLAGVYFDSMFLIIGILLGILAICSVYVVKYMAIIVIPAAIIVGLLLVWRFLIKSKSRADN